MPINPSITSVLQAVKNTAVRVATRYSTQWVHPTFKPSRKALLFGKRYVWLALLRIVPWQSRLAGPARPHVGWSTGGIMVEGDLEKALSCRCDTAISSNRRARNSEIESGFLSS